MPTARPILFSAPMIRALLDGRKTQTRRIIKPQPKSSNLGYTATDGGAIQCGADYPDGDDDFVKCPYGRPGDLLWVRESFTRLTVSATGFPDHEEIWYQAFTDKIRPVANYDHVIKELKWKPSIHMPRAFSRLTLEITDVRVQCLQDITEADAIAEGIHQPLSKYACPYVSPKHPDGKARIGINACEMFEDLWKAINGPGSWGANPWVWALTFNVHNCNVDALLQQKAA